MIIDFSLIFFVCLSYFGAEKETKTVETILGILILHRLLKNTKKISLAVYLK